MDLEALYGGSFVGWEGVAGSFAKRTLSSRLMLFAARRYLEEAGGVTPVPGRTLEGRAIPEEVCRSYAAPPDPASPAARRWGEFLDAALATELEVVSYGERPPILHQLRSGLELASEEAGKNTPLGRWFVERRAALPGGDLPDDPEYLPV